MEHGNVASILQGECRMTIFSGSPRLTKGAIVGLDPLNPIASVIVFQYNPSTLTRTIQPQMGEEGGDKTETLRLRGAPIETIKIDVEIDAADGQGGTPALGVYPQLSALEMLVYPKSALVIANTVLMAAGTIEVVPPSAPLTLFIWGPKRVVPVRLVEFTIVEETHDPSLNPIQAKVTLGMQVLTYNDLPLDNPGYYLFLAHQVIKEDMAMLGSVKDLAAVAGANIKLI